MIELRELTKHFGAMTAVDRLSFRVERGEAMGFIGPNGAGKTTTIRMLATLLQPDSGTATIDGLDVVRDREQVRGLLGYMPDVFGLYEQMQVWEYLDFCACAHRIPYRQRRGLIGDVLELVDLQDKREADVATLSRGMTQRLLLAMTLIHDPQVLLLDEPASGLDPRSRVEIRQLLQELCRMNKTLFISSHILSELAEICTRVAIIDQGRLVIAGSLAEIAATLGESQRLLVRVSERGAEACELLQSCEGVRSAQLVGHDITVIFSGGDEVQQRLLARLVERGFPVLSFSRQDTSLEDLYMRVVQTVEGAG